MNVRIRQLDAARKLKVYRNLDEVPSEENFHASAPQSLLRGSVSSSFPDFMGPGKGKEIASSFSKQKRVSEENFVVEEKQVAQKLIELKEKILIPEIKKVTGESTEQPKKPEELERKGEYLRFMGERTITNSTYTMLDISYGEEIKGWASGEYDVDMEASEEDMEFY